MAGGDDQGVWSSIFQGLRDHPEAILAAAMAFVALSLYIGGAPVWAAVGVPIALYLLYLGRMTLRERHVERMADKQLVALEQTRGREVLHKAQRAIERRRNKHDRA